MTSFSNRCPRYERCSAPLCPLDETTWQGVVWYADDAICQQEDFKHLEWIEKQRRLAKAKKKGYFTVEMLIAITRLTSDGIDPDSRETPEGWINKRR